MIKKPNFLIIGAAKCGTTTLYDLLCNHPQIFLSSQKELKYFNVDKNFNKGEDWYFSKFESSNPNHKVIGEATPGYLYDERAPKRIFEMFGPDLKLIIILRNPVERAISAYNHMVREGAARMRFEDIIKVEDEFIKRSESDSRFYSLFTRGLYFEQIERYMKFFKKENFLILSFENDLMSSQKKTYDKISTFLKVENYPLKNIIHSNAHKTLFNKLKLKREIKSLLDLVRGKGKLITEPVSFSEKEKKHFIEKYFKSDIEKLNELTDNNFINWV